MNFFVYDNPGLETMFRGFAVLILALWTIPWKGWALWKAAKAGSKPWFIALLIVNTVGILDILYIYVFSKKSHNSGTSATPSNQTAV